MAIETVTEEVAQNLEEAAQITRSIDSRGVGFFLGGVGVGVLVGFYFGHRWNREKIKAEAFKASEEEVERIRAVYQGSRSAAARQKPSVEEIIEEKGYTAPVPPSPQRPLRPPVPVSEPIREVVPTWDYASELSKRDPSKPYIIHQDEYKNSEKGFNHVAYTYYAVDDVLVDEDDTPIPHADIVVGQDNLRFGHGTDDVDVVFVRNEHMELEMEICRTHQSYEEEVLGHDRDESD